MPSLNRADAARRASILQVRECAVDLDLTRGEEYFESTTRLRLRCLFPGASTFIELLPARLHEVTLNGSPINPATLVGNRVPLPGLDPDNTLVLRASMPYSHSGEGLHRFVDPADGSTYLYAQSFLDDAPRIFACFDQPDIKIPLSLTVTAPAHWTVLGNSPVQTVQPGQWVFDTTPPLSTYLMTVVAGEYHSRYVEHDGIRLGLHCKSSLAEHLDREADELFTITRQCFDRYHKLFRVRYAFGKYDQVFVPEFNAGAMENPGCVTFRDEFVFRSAVTEAEREERAVAIAHEMAHMWFGDLVTMRWWDDLWLNESFAEYLGSRVVTEATRFTGAWTTFAVTDKAWGYAADQRPSTHPVAPEDVANTAAAFQNFDGISYAKGAAVLRQLVAWVGDDAFFAGLRKYFRTHRFGNASLADLLGALESTSRRDLAGWSQAWLREAGVNTLRPVASVDASRHYKDVKLAQADGTVLRPHRLTVGLYDRRPTGVVRLRSRTEVELDPAVDGGLSTVVGLDGVPAADLLLVNDTDLTYAKVRLLDRDMAALPALLPAVADPLARAVLWSTAWDCTRDAELPATALVELAAAALPSETDIGLFTAMLDCACAIAVPMYLAPPKRPRALALLANACRVVLSEAAPAGGGRRLAAARGFARCAGQAEAAVLHGWLAERDVPDDVVMDAELRWLVLRRLVVLGEASAADIDAEANRDRGAQGAEHAAACRAALPELAAKAVAWQAIVGDVSLSNRALIATASGFWQPEQSELTGSYVERYFADLPQLAERLTPQVLTMLARAAFPRYAVEPATIALAKRLLERGDLDPALRRAVLDKADDLRRALAARATC
jgi:aminopeptidase N